jgi:preprotein translocase subunit SecE
MDAEAGQNRGKDKAVADPPKPRVTALEFLAQVRQETAKVTWPTRRETTVTSIAVLIMVVLAMAFFFTVDWLIGHLVSFVLSLV